MDTLENTTKVYLTEEEAKSFILFQKYRWLFDKLVSIKFFEVEFGKFTMNVAFGDVQNIIREEVVYKRKL